VWGCLFAQLSAEITPERVEAFLEGNNDDLSELSTHLDQVLPLITKEPPVVDREEVQVLLKQLGAAKYADRESATLRLIEFGKNAIPQVEDYRDQWQGDPEIRLRCKRILNANSSAERSPEPEEKRTDRIILLMAASSKVEGKHLKQLKGHYQTFLRDRKAVRHLALFEEIAPRSPRRFLAQLHLLEMDSTQIEHWLMETPNYRWLLEYYRMVLTDNWEDKALLPKDKLAASFANEAIHHPAKRLTRNQWALITSRLKRKELLYSLLNTADVKEEHINAFRSVYLREVKKPRSLLSLDEKENEIFQRFVYHMKVLDIEMKTMEYWMYRAPILAQMEFLRMTALHPEKGSPLLSEEDYIAVMLKALEAQQGEEDMTPHWDRFVYRLREDGPSPKEIWRQLKLVEPLPEELLKRAEFFMATRGHRHSRIGILLRELRDNDHLTKRYLESRDVLEKGEGVEFPVSPEELSDEDLLFWVEVAVHWDRRGEHSNIYPLMRATRRIPEETILPFIKANAGSFRFLDAIAEHRPLLRDHISKILCEKAETKDLSYSDFRAIAQFFARYSPAPCKPGVFDNAWERYLKEHKKRNGQYLMGRAPDMHITPSVLRRNMIQHPELVPSRHFVYLLEQGDEEDIRYALEAISQGGIKEGYSGSQFFSSFTSVPADKHDDLFLLQMRLFWQVGLHQHQSLYKWMFEEHLGGKRYLNTRAYFSAHEDTILTFLKLEDPQVQIQLIPMICMFAMDPVLAETHRESFIRILETGLNGGEYKRPPDRFAVAAALLLLGHPNETAIDLFLNALQAPQKAQVNLWHLLHLLDERHDYLLPELKKRYLHSESSAFPLYAMLMIAPDNPEVKQVAYRILLEGKDRDQAAAVLSRLRQVDRLPDFSQFSKERLDWFFKDDTYEEYWQILTLARSYPNQPELEKRFLELLPTIAAVKHKPLDNLTEFFTGTPVLQTELRDAVLALMEKKDKPTSRFLYWHLEHLPELKREHLDQFLNYLKLLRRIEPGQDRTFILVNFAQEVDDFTREDEMRMIQHIVYTKDFPNLLTQSDQLLANIHRGKKPDFRCFSRYALLAHMKHYPKIRERAFQELISAYRSEPFRRELDDKRIIKYLSRMRGREEQITALMKEVLENYLNPGEGKILEDRTAQYAIEYLQDTLDDEECIRLYHQVVKAAQQSDAIGEIIPMIIWSMITRYPEKADEFLLELEKVPFSIRSTYPYRLLKAKAEKFHE